MIVNSILLLALNVALGSLGIVALTLLVACTGRLLPIRHAVLVAGLAACLVSPIAITAGWIGNWGQLPYYDSIAGYVRAEVVGSSSLAGWESVKPALADPDFVLAPESKRMFSIGQADQAAFDDAGSFFEATGQSSTLVVFPPDSQPVFNGLSYLGIALILVWVIGVVFSFSLYFRSWRQARELVRQCEPIAEPRLKKLAA